MTTVRELIGWSLDENRHRPTNLQAHVAAARQTLASEPVHPLESALLEIPTALEDLLKAEATRPDLAEEMCGLDWSLGLIDLRHLVAFQRRLSLDQLSIQPVVPDPANWPGLTEVTLSQPRLVRYSSAGSIASGAVTITSPNPDLTLRPTADPEHPFRIHGGSPFLEVAHYRDRWILRDGYHRALLVLSAGVHQVPAVLIEARTIAEVGAIHPWFFSEDELFSPRPPRVTDFLSDALTIEYPRPRLHKTIRIHIEETFEPNATPSESGVPS
ncbi:hypothetical protein [Granulicella sibirica]|uniref:Uncharacterized protein n=1 Tax=Granulicella sibirica TaxID=2479048 RepID=A0A4Q0T259_9BACT|nr:hypothetical protein [Granulicella sibirica]RXH56912.1 hypothetical protein GRAN_0222 [Granulicella sibirica]